MTAIPRAVETPSRMGFQAIEKAGWPIPCCDSCNVQLNVSWDDREDSRNPWHVNEVVRKGAARVIGSNHLCSTCVADEGLTTARIRRIRRMKRGGNYVE
jgi:hypothetical protein